MNKGKKKKKKYKNWKLQLNVWRNNFMWKCKLIKILNSKLNRLKTVYLILNINKECILG